MASTSDNLAQDVSTLSDLLRIRAAEESERCAYTFVRDDSDAGRMSCTDLLARSQQVAGWLRANLDPGDRALLLYPPGHDFLAGFFGCLEAGIVAAPLPLPTARTGLEKLALVQRDTRAKTALTTSELLDDRFRAAAASAGIHPQATDTLDPALGAGSRPAPSNSGPAYLQYTSGSTSAPRGVMITHRNVLHNLANIDAGFEHTPDSVAVTWLPHFHDMGLIYGLLAPLYVGMPCYFMSPASFVQRPRLWLETITRYGGTHSGGPNFAYDLCVRRIPAKERETLDLSSWQVAFNGAEPVHAETLERFAEEFRGCGFRRNALHPAYGLAEASLKVTGGTKGGGPVFFSADGAALSQNRVAPAPEGDGHRIVGCGRPGLDTEVVIVDPETGQRCPPDEVGEIWVSGPGVAAGYWRRPDDTKATFGATLSGDPETRFLRTGDLGFFRNGELFVVGRTKDLIIIRGLNHHPNDLELTTRHAHEAIATNIAVAFSIEENGLEKLVIVVESGRREPDDPAAIARAVRGAIAGKHEVRVHSFVLVKKGGIPKTSSGKVQRRLSRSMYLSGELKILFEDKAKESAEPEFETVLDRKTLLAVPTSDRRPMIVAYLRRLIAAALKIEPKAIDPDRRVTELGLDSLGAVEIQNRLETDFEVTVAAVELLEGATIVRLAEIIETGLEDNTRTARPIRPRGGTRAPLSFEQERLWLLDQVAPDSAAFHVPFAFRLRGSLDRDALESAIRAVVERHESLRTAFLTENGGPHTDLVSAERPLLTIDDLTGLPLADRYDEAIERATDEIRRPFRLEDGCLFRVCGFRLEDNEHLILALMHHIVADVWSMRLFIGEVLDAYQSIAAGEEPSFEPLPIQYGDYSVWQREQLQGPRLERLLEYWRGKLEDAPTLELSPDNPRPERPTLAGATESISLPDDVTEAVRAVAKERNTTVFTVLLAAFQALAAHCSGQSDVVVGTTNANRLRAELDRLIGFFAAPLVVRTDLSGNPDLNDTISRTRATLLEAYSHQELPFARVVEAAHPGRQSSYTPLFQVMFSVVKSMLPVEELPGLDFEAIELGTGATDFDLFVNIIEEPRSLRALVVYSTDLYSDQKVRNLMAAYIDVLRTMVKAPSTTLSALPVPKELVQPAPAPSDAAPPPDLIVAATFTAEPIEEVASFWNRKLGFDYRIRFAPYNQVFQQLLDPSSRMNRNRNGINVILVRLEDWARTGDSHDLAVLEDNARNFATALNAASERNPVPFLVCLCASSPDFRSDEERAAEEARVEDYIAASVAGRSSVHVVRTGEIDALYPVDEYADTHGDRLGHVPYTPSYFAAVATTLARKIHAMRTAPYKVIVLDCDQTLWNGVCGEDGPKGVTIDKPRHALQQFMVEQREAGMLLAIASKNNEEDVWATFEAHPDMPLKREHIVAWRINWDPKAGNLRAMATELGLGLDSFIFVDDSPTECAEVEAGAPEVLALELPHDDDRIRPFLDHVWAFDHLTTTEEDKKRSAMYGQRLERRRLQHRVSTLSEFLEALDLEVKIGPIAPNQIPRVSQLTQRTNQFNLTTVRRTEGEIRQFLEDGEALAVNVTDRFGDYGLVGVALFRTEPSALAVDTFLLSCRALGRGVEHQMLARLGELATERGLPSVKLECRETAKNKPARKFLASVIDGYHPPGREVRAYIIPADRAAEVSYDPVDQPGEPPRESTDTAFPGELQHAVDYARLATELHDAGSILAAAGAGPDTEAASTVPYEEPRTPLERRLAAIWSEMLNVPQVGVSDNFFDLGGHSLLAVQLLSRIRTEFQVDLALDVVFTGTFNIAELAKAIELFEIEQAGADEYQELLKELDGLSDEEARALLEQEEKTSES